VLDSKFKETKVDIAISNSVEKEVQVDSRVA
jgi:hypothetical protein